MKIELFVNDLSDKRIEDKGEIQWT